MDDAQHGEPQEDAKPQAGPPRTPWVVGVSGASGTPYAAAVLRALLAAGQDVDLVVSRAARLTLLDETGGPFRDAHWRTDLARLLARGADGDPAAYPVPDLDRVRHWPAGDLAAGPSSGSYPARGMLIVPASTACVAGVALGLSKDLLQRAASVTLKERRPLVVAVRETPLSGQTLRHLVALDDAGAAVLPASPAFYTGATHIQDLVDFVAGRALDAAGVPHTLYRRWQGGLGRADAQGAGPAMP
ncbi:UbiX family flavin prenyltransferase [Streptomyces sp. NPDC004031]